MTAISAGIVIYCRSVSAKQAISKSKGKPFCYLSPCYLSPGRPGGSRRGGVPRGSQEGSRGRGCGGSRGGSQGGPPSPPTLKSICGRCYTEVGMSHESAACSRSIFDTFWKFKLRLSHKTGLNHAYNIGIRNIDPYKFGLETTNRRSFQRASNKNHRIATPNSKILNTNKRSMPARAPNSKGYVQTRPTNKT